MDIYITDATSHNPQHLKHQLMLTTGAVIPDNPANLNNINIYTHFFLSSQGLATQQHVPSYRTSIERAHMLVAATARTHSTAARKQQKNTRSIMDPTAEFEIDTMILDYICSKAILETITKRAEELAGRPPIEETNILTLFDSA